jgi:hypothetical protein
MISWVRYVLGQTQEAEQQATATATTEPMESLLEAEAPPAETMGGAA